MRWVVGLGLLGVLALGALGAFAYATTTIPSPSGAATAATTTVLFADGSVMGRLSSKASRTPLSPAAMPKVAKEAAVASEDRTFYSNRGVSYRGLARAVEGVLTGRPDLGGGSTITQQYVKNITGNDQHTYTRKAREAFVALKMDQRYSKDYILTQYLNTIYFGRGAYGVATAARAYFGVSDPAQLTWQQAALLIGIVPSPSAWDPKTDPADAQARYRYVVAGMVKLGYLTQAQADASPTMPATVTEVSPRWMAGTNGYLLHEVQAEAERELGIPDAGHPSADDVLDQQGLTITSTIRPDLQQEAVATMDDPDAYPTYRRQPSVHAGLVSIDPATGGVVAMYGGSAYLQDQYDTITQAQAQAGSTFKAFTLVGALEQGVSLSDEFNGDNDVVVGGKPVHNFGGEDLGEISLLTATEQSVNTVFEQLNEQIGPATTKKVAAEFGVDDVPDVLSNVLGTATVRPLDMAGAYAAFAAGGVYRTPHFVTSITHEGTRRYTADTSGTRVADRQVIAELDDALEHVVTHGTAEDAVGDALGDQPAAGKTGTVSGNHAAWFDGYTPQLATVAVVYAADPKGGQMTIPPFGHHISEVTGGTIPADIWTSFMAKALAGQPVVDFPAPARSSDNASDTPTATATATDGTTSSPTGAASGGSSGATSTATSSSDGSTPSASPTGDGGEPTGTSTPTTSASPTPGAGGSGTAAARGAGGGTGASSGTTVTVSSGGALGTDG